MNCGLCKQPIRGNESYTTDHYKCGAELADSFRDDIGRMQWALDNIYTIAVREERYGGTHGKPWAHVRRLCERFGCAVRAVRPAGKDGEQKYGYADDAKAEGKP